MDPDRRARLWALVVARASGELVTISHVCRVIMYTVGVDGVSVTLTARPAAQETAWVSDDRAAELAELALTVGEGPGHDALEVGGPVLVADMITRDMGARWPGFAPAAVSIGARALLALPLQIGAIRLGVLTLYRTTPGGLDHDQLADLLELADAACLLLLSSADGSGPAGTTDGSGPVGTIDGSGRAGTVNGARPAGGLNGSGPAGGLDGSGPAGTIDGHPPWLPDGLVSQIHQATGMIMVQLGVSADVAFLRLRADAYFRGRRLRDLADDVVARRVRFNREGE